MVPRSQDDPQDPRTVTKEGGTLGGPYAQGWSLRPGMVAKRGGGAPWMVPNTSGWSPSKEELGMVPMPRDGPRDPGMILKPGGTLMACMVPTQAQRGAPRRQAHPVLQHHQYFGSTKVWPKFR